MSRGTEKELDTVKAAWIELYEKTADCLALPSTTQRGLELAA